MAKGKEPEKAKDTPEAKTAPEAAKPTTVPTVEVGAGVATTGPANPVPAGNLNPEAGEATRFDPNEATGKARPANQPAAFPNTHLGLSLKSPAGGGQGLELDDPADAPVSTIPPPAPRPKFTQKSDAAVPITQLGFWDAGPIQVWDVVKKFREVLDDLNRGAYWEAADDLGDLFKMVPPIFVTGQHATIAETTARARFEAAEEFEGFDEIEKKIQEVKGRAFGAAGVGESGAAAVAGVQHAYVMVTPGDVAAIIGAVEMLFEWFKKLRDRRGV